MVRFRKIRPRRGSLAVSIIWGSPIAASSRSAEFAYRIGSLRHDSRYSAIDMSVWLRASNDRAKALNRESLYMIPLHGLKPPHWRNENEPGYKSVPARRRINASTLALLDTRRPPFRNAKRKQVLLYQQALRSIVRQKCFKDVSFG